MPSLSTYDNRPLYTLMRRSPSGEEAPWRNHDPQECRACVDDHMRAMTFLIAAGAAIERVGGYVLRSQWARMRHENVSGHRTILHTFVDTFAGSRRRVYKVASARDLVGGCASEETVRRRPDSGLRDLKSVRSLGSGDGVVLGAGSLQLTTLCLPLDSRDRSRP